MPDSMTKLEINDVLSSIRRLVSGEKVDRKGPDLPADDFFVLTPSHRISEKNETSDSLPDLSLSQVTEKTEDDIAPAPFELLNPAFPDHSVEEAKISGPLRDEYDQIVKEKSAILTELFPAPVDANVSDEILHADRSPEVAKTSLEDRIAELEEAVERSGGEWEPDGSEDDTIQLPKRHLFEIINEEIKASINGTKEESSRSEDMDSGPTDENLVAVEKPVEVITPEVLPPLRLAEVATFSHVPQREVPFEEVELLDEAPANAEILTGDDDIFVDEDLLRRVVSDIVREELQGKLGERMTRNIKRMVRREVEQSLSLKKFD